MKAFWIDEETIWAAPTFAEAIADYEQETGEKPDGAELRELDDSELDRPMPEIDEDERPTGEMTTLRRYLNEMTAPGMLACIP